MEQVVGKLDQIANCLAFIGLAICFVAFINIFRK